jgi:hypothetical protein
MTASIPSLLVATIGGDSGSSYSIELSDSKLRYSSRKDDGTLPVRDEIEPTAAQWREFGAALDSIDIWQWQNDYPRELPICDGTQWTLDIAYGDTALHTGGDNAYPRDDDDDGTIPSAAPSARFERFMKAVSALIGGRDFG